MFGLAQFVRNASQRGRSYCQSHRQSRTGENIRCDDRKGFNCYSRCQSALWLRPGAGQLLTTPLFFHGVLAVGRCAIIRISENPVEFETL